MTNPPAEYDSPWKQALFEYFPACTEFFFPEIYADINWERGYEFLNTELQQIVREAELGKRLADALVKVWRQNGSETWVLIHIEIQGQQESDFAERMYVYHCRIFDLYRRPVASLAILADERASWRPNEYVSEIWQCRASLLYPIAKLLDYESQWQMLESSNNPFAVIVMAHLKTIATRQDSRGRLQWKLSLIKGLYERGYSRQAIIDLFLLIDWMMVLPIELERNFRQTITSYQEETRMRYVSSIERLAREDAIIESRREGAIDILSTRFGEVPISLVEALNRIEDASVLKTIHNRAITTSSLADFQQVIDELTSQGRTEST